MRYKFIIFFLLIGFVSKAQVYQLMPQYGYSTYRMNFDSTIQIPTFCGVPKLGSNKTNKGALAFDSCNNRFYYFNPKLQVWDTIKSADASLFVKYTDTAQMLSVYLKESDTSSLSNRINTKIDSLYKSGDSVYARKNGVFVFQYIDSAQNLQKVTDAGNITTNNIIINDGLNGETGIDLYDGANASYVQIRTIDGGIKLTNTYSSSDFAHIYGNNQGRTQLKLGINSLGTTGVIKNNFITSSKNYELPNNSGTFALSVNNNYADSAGNITIPTIDTNSLRRVKYVGLTMPSAFNVTGSPITDSGTIAVTGAGTASQYVRGDGVLASFPTATTGGGASVSYYLNGSVNKGTFGGETYYEMSRTAIIGAGTDFTRTNAQGDGVVAQFITDTITNLLIPAGNWNLELYFSASSGGGTPSFYVELYKYDGTNFTLISSNSTSPELIAFGTTINPYFCALAVPETILSGTDRLAIRVFVNTSGRSITLHTENSHLCQVITTFTTGLTAINGLTKQVQYFATGTSGTDFNISSSNDTHTFNLPTASATNRGALSSADWSTFNGKLNPSDTTSLSNRINTKLNISDTANTWVTSVFRKTASDSVFFVRGGSNNFAFRDSLGGGSISPANPTASVGLTAVNGTAGTFMRSDAAPALSQSISPTWTGFHTFNRSATASGAIARGTLFNPSLTASANNDVMVGLDVSPTFSNGAFTGVQNYGLRVQNPSGQAMSTIESYGNASFLLFRQANGTLASPTQTLATNATGIIGGRGFTNAGFMATSPATIRFLADESYSTTGFGSSISLFTTPIGSTTSAESMRVYGSGNVAINQSTDAGFKLDVNGVSRFQNNVLINENTNFGFRLDVNGQARIQNKLTVGSATSTSAILEATSTTQGFLQPRMTTSQMNAISTPATGLSVFNTTDSAVYIRRGTGAGWQQVANEIIATGTLDFANTNAQNSTDLTITLTGAVDGDAVVLGVPNAAVNANSCYTAWVSAANTVTVRFNNYSSGAINPASATFKVTIIK